LTKAHPIRAAQSTKSPESPVSISKTALLSAAEACLKRHGYAGLSTRRVAEEAGIPLSQIHYHFGSKQGLVMSLLEFQNQQRLDRQRSMFAEGIPLWTRWEKACDYLDDDLGSGYVRVLQEMIAAGWSNPEIATEVQRFLDGWLELLTRIAREAADTLGGLGPFSPAEAATLVGDLFLGAETTLLLDIESKRRPTRRALRKVGELLKAVEKKNP
jgi:AcrR family transcriptional regulator